MRFTIPGQPVPQGRGIAVRRGNTVRIVDPQKSREYKKTVAWAAEQYMNRFNLSMMEGALEVRLQFFYRLPKGLHRVRTPVGHCSPHAGRGDIDNLCKGVLDGLTGVAYEDDRTVAWLTASKWWGAQGDEPHTTVQIGHFAQGGPND